MIYYFPNLNFRNLLTNKMSHSLSLSDVERSIKKVTAIVDIHLKNLNDSFLVDNFQPVNKLRNTILRSEFNNLCKGKTEAKNIANVGYENDKKIFLCKEDQIRDIPPMLQPLFDKPKKYYILGTPSNFSFFYSLLSILDNDFILQGKIQKDKIIDELRNTLVYQLDDFYQSHGYKQKRFKKTVIKENILNSKIFLPQVIHYILDYHNICLLVIDTETYFYNLANDYSEDRKYILMLRKNNYYQPILNSEGNTSFTFDILDTINGILKPEFEINRQVKVTPPKVEIATHIQSDVNSITLNKESSYKLPELQEIAMKLGITIKKTGTQRNKKKSDLYEEIKTKLG